jgi:hypothetical protein
VSPEIALINAIRTALKADASVAALIGANVFDQVSAQSTPPYIYVGPAGRTRVWNDCFQVWTQRIRLYVIYTTWNRTEVWTAAEALIQALDLKRFDLAAPYEQQEEIRITQAGDVIDPNAPKSVFVDLTATIARAT